ncbi:uncharacterized protein LOC143716171 isoform X1 [Siphateles boraxobius]|uniref:uncharacterized protein LOC143716171 isoform X1 n=1 Tax=Siphateles boraxobius TaxID=180520 RepID=UPI00406296F2
MAAEESITCDMIIQVLLYVPNVIGYIRILLVLSSWMLYSYPENFVPLYVLSIILDGVDGWVARKLQQTSRFGAWLDVVIDNVGRGMLWNMLYDGEPIIGGYLPLADRIRGDSAYITTQWASIKRLPELAAYLDN